jgi:hypothetical protein
MVALYPGGPRSSGPNWADESDVRADTAEVGVKVWSGGLVVLLPKDGATPRADELKEEVDAEYLEAMAGLPATDGARIGQGLTAVSCWPARRLGS